MLETDSYGEVNCGCTFIADKNLIVFRGKIEDQDFGDPSIICVDDCPVLPWLAGNHYSRTKCPIDIIGKQCSARWWVADIDMGNALDRIEATVSISMGLPELEFEPRYSEITGYLWTDETLKIGGHNILDVLESNEGKHIYLEIEVHG